MAYLRTGQRGFLDRARHGRRTSRLAIAPVQGTPSLTYCYDRDNFGLDHVYGYGLIAWSEYSGDAAALTEAENNRRRHRAILGDTREQQLSRAGQFRDGVLRSAAGCAPTCC